MSKTKSVFLTLLVIFLMVASFMVARSIYHKPDLINQLSLENYTLDQENRLRKDTIRMQWRTIEKQREEVTDYRHQVVEIQKEIIQAHTKYHAIKDSIADLPSSNTVEMFVQITGGDQGGVRYGISEGNVREGVSLIIKGAHCQQELILTQEIVRRQDRTIASLEAINLNKGIIISQQETIIDNQETIIHNQRVEGAIAARQNRRLRIIAGVATIVGAVVGYVL